jgi:uncharacterized protein YacL
MSPKNTKDPLLNVSVWRYLVNFWTLALFTLIVFDFLGRNSLVVLIGPVASIYIAVLAIYTAQKEFERWHDNNLGRHPGEVYVVLWTILVVGLFILQLFYSDVYKMPSEIYTTYIVVIGVLAITKRSKASYLSKKKGR